MQIEARPGGVQAVCTRSAEPMCKVQVDLKTLDSGAVTVPIFQATTRFFYLVNCDSSRVWGYVRQYLHPAAPTVDRGAFLYPYRLG